MEAAVATNNGYYSIIEGSLAGWRHTIVNIEK